ncbi:MAG: helix-turn-helix domain-containing protein [[Clostridium] innocuum]
MEIGKKLKEARINSGLTQEQVAEDIKVTRQTISNWENERSYPDIMNVIDLSNLYSLSLDDLLKGDDKMIEHLEENTNIVKSNRKLIAAIMINVLLVILLVAFNMFLRDNQYYLIGVFCFAIISSAALLYQIIKKNYRRKIWKQK